MTPAPRVRDLMRLVVNRLYTCHLKAGDSDFFGMLDWAVREAREWDEPVLDEVMLEGLEARRSREQEWEGCSEWMLCGGGLARYVAHDRTGRAHPHRASGSGAEDLETRRCAPLVDAGGAERHHSGIVSLAGLVSPDRTLIPCYVNILLTVMENIPYLDKRGGAVSLAP